MTPDVEQQILSRIETLLKHHPKGLTTSDISRHLKNNRNSTAKYLAILQTSGIVEKDRIGASNVYRLSRKVSIQNLLNYISELVLVLDSEGRVAFVNDAFPVFFSIDRNLVLGNHLETIPLDILRIIHERNLLADMTGEFSEEIILPGNGRTHHFRVHGLPVIFENKKNGYTLIIENLSDRRRIEEQLVLSEAKYRSVIEQQTDLICRRDPSGTITFANAAYYRFFRKEQGTLEGTDFYPVDLMPGLAAEPDSAKARILPFCNDVFEQCLLLDNGEVRWVQWKNASGTDSSGNLTEILSVGRDITHQREREREMLIMRCSIESSPYGAVIFDMMGRIIYTNQKFREIFCCPSPEEIAGTLLERFIPHDDPNDNICQLTQSLLETGRWAGRVRGWRTDNQVLDLEMHSATIRNDRYFPIHGIALLTPWTPRRDSPGDFPDPAVPPGPLPRPRGVFIIDPSGRILQVNRDFLRIAGYDKKQEILGRKADEFWNPDRNESNQPSYGSTEKNAQRPGLLRGRSGAAIPIMACQNPLFDSTGTHLCSEIWIEPDWDRALAGFAGSADFFPFPTFATDRNRNVLIWNRAMEVFTSIGRNDMIGTSEYQKAFYSYHGMQPSLIDLVNQPLEAIRQLYPEIRQYGNLIMLERYIPDSGAGGGMYLLEKAAPLVGPDGSPIGAIESIQDITGWKRSREQLDRMKEEIDTGLSGRFQDLVDRIEKERETEGTI